MDEKYKITQMDENIAKIISAWQYPGDYAIYNLPSFETMKKQNYSILDKDKSDNYFCFWDGNHNLAAYINVSPKDENTVFLGIGLSPSFCGKGNGAKILNMGVEIIKARYPSHTIRLKVRAWNRRAIKCYTSVGFNIDKTEMLADYKGDLAEFVTMSMQPAH